MDRFKLLGCGKSLTLLQKFLDFLYLKNIIAGSILSFSTVGKREKALEKLNELASVNLTLRLQKGSQFIQKNYDKQNCRQFLDVSILMKKNA